MRRIQSFRESMKSLTSRQRSPYLCATCTHKASAVSTLIVRGTRPTSNARNHVYQRRWTTSQNQVQEDANTARYEPATTSDELENVGMLTNTWDGYWNDECNFKGFSRAGIVTDPLEVTAALRRAIIETFAVQQTRTSTWRFSPAAPGPDLTHGVQIRPLTTGIQLIANTSCLEQIARSLNGIEFEDAAKLPLPDTPNIAPSTISTARATTNPISFEPAFNPSEEEAVDAANESLPQGPLSDLITSWDPSWLNVLLDDQEVRFAVFKRVMQLTGLRVPDAAMSSKVTAGVFLDLLMTPAKPRKVSDALAQKHSLASIPNVQVQKQRITLIDKERTVGRWKIIERELRNRDLPVPKQQALPRIAVPIPTGIL